ncbi:hypothetical protein M569_09497, partial [Genlisea aurea]
MGDHFVLLVDRLLTESTLEAAIESRNSAASIMKIREDSATVFFQESKIIKPPSSTRIVECRICQDEDVDSNMEAPCSCSGSLKASSILSNPSICRFLYAHRKCVQKWCNEKGDTTCEICHQQFEPGYTAPPPIFRIPVNLRGNWRISRRDLNNHRIIAMVSTDHSFLDPDYEEYSASRSVFCCRAVAAILMIFLILRHTLPIIVGRNGSYSFPLIMLVLLRVVGIVLPVCVILRAVTSVLKRQQQ